MWNFTNKKLEAITKVPDDGRHRFDNLKELDRTFQHRRLVGPIVSRTHTLRTTFRSPRSYQTSSLRNPKIRSWIMVVRSIKINFVSYDSLQEIRETKSRMVHVQEYSILEILYKFFDQSNEIPLVNKKLLIYFTCSLSFLFYVCRVLVLGKTQTTQRHHSSKFATSKTICETYCRLHVFRN